MRTDPLSTPAERTVPSLLARQADTVGDDLYLLDSDGAALTFHQSSELADRYAESLRRLGVTRRDTVALLMENSAAQAVLSFAVNRLGAIWSPVSTDYRGEWLGATFADMHSDVLVVDGALLPVVASLGDLPFKHVVVNGAAAAALRGVTTHDLASFATTPAVRPDVDLWYGDTNAILWTSGTTGRSKGVMQPHNAWLTWSKDHNERRGGIREGERFYACVPMYNSGGWITNIYPALVAGVPACIDKRFSVGNFWDRTRHYGASHVMTLGTMHLYLFQQPAAENDADNPVRTMLHNPVIPQILRPFMDRFGVELVWSGFGQSEVMGATVYTSARDLKPGSCGFPETALVETRLLDDNDEEVARGETGEICVRGKHPFVLYSGYYNDGEQTLAAFRNQWHHSGDLGRIDADGELFFVDRKKDSTRHKGRNISSFEVEHIARQFPGVLMAAAYGVKLSELEHEEELMITVMPAPGSEIDPLEFCKFIDSKAPYFFVPRYVDVAADLPLTPTQKVQKFKLRDRGLTTTTWDREASTDWRPTRK